MKKNRSLVTGSWSEATTLASDIIPAAFDMAASVRMSREDRNKVRALRAEWDAIDGEPDEAYDDLLEELRGIVEAYAPAGHYVGMHPGDGADFGVWASQDVPATEGDDPSVADDGNGTVFKVSDHGNILGVWSACYAHDGAVTYHYQEVR